MHTLVMKRLLCHENWQKQRGGTHQRLSKKHPGPKFYRVVQLEPRILSLRLIVVVQTKVKGAITRTDDENATLGIHQSERFKLLMLVLGGARRAHPAYANAFDIGDLL